VKGVAGMESKVFNHKKYELKKRCEHKSTANITAKYYRERGYLARIKYNSDKDLYEVFVRER
jgi:hypothetical protein